MRDALGHLLDTVRLRLQDGEPAATADDLLTWCRRLLTEVADLHERQLVMGDELDFDGLALSLADPEGRRPTHQNAALARVAKEAERAVDVVSRLAARTDLDSGVTEVDPADVYPDLAAVPTLLEHPVYVGALHSWEEALGHHDSLVDIAVLGQLMLALVTGLDPYDADDVAALAAARERLSVAAPQLHPVVARLLREMTAVDRARRSPDLAEVLLRLDSYREVPEDFDVDEIAGYRTASPEQQRRLLHTTLRDRLFDTSRRNKLLWFSPSAQTVDLTVGSVPQLLDHRGISPNALLTWQGKVASTLSAGKQLSLTSYLRFDESPYLSPTLDKAIATARRDRAEYGFAQLRLVIAFLRWHDLKATKGPAEEVIESPLLMLPVDLSKKKGVRDSYVITPTGTVAEVNPALRHRLGELYDLELPENVDLSVTSVKQFHAELARRVEASEPAVSVALVEKPQIDLVQRQARRPFSITGKCRIRLSVIKVIHCSMVLPGSIVITFSVIKSLTGISQSGRSSRMIFRTQSRSEKIPSTCSPFITRTAPTFFPLPSSLYTLSYRLLKLIKTPRFPFLSEFLKSESDVTISSSSKGKKIIIFQIVLRSACM